MRVILSPGVRAFDDEVVVTLSEGLAGPEGVSLTLGLSGEAFRRSLSDYEIYRIREALLGVDPDSHVRTDDSPAPVVGYVCAGSAQSRACRCEVVAVADHVNLVWRSPLTGPNEDRLGPRFPVTAGMYAPCGVMKAAGSAGGVAVRKGVVAGVRDDTRQLGFEAEMVRAHGYLASSCELVPVALLAAHLGFRLAAAVIIAG